VLLDRTFYDRPTLDVARELLGKVLVHETGSGRLGGVIVEVEAYIGEDDPACHAAAGPTRRNAPLYGPPGFTYVYFSYGMHYLVNAVTEREGAPAAVLIRALAPLEGLDEMRRRRGEGPGTRAAKAADHALCRGPGNVTKALAIGRSENRRDLTSGSLRIEDRGLDVGPVAWSPRIGIRAGLDRQWRAYVPGHPAVSGRATLRR
jgi:DNA-3-methyladenine glycosylase